MKGNLHSHTKVSDGPMEPRELAAAYREKGYDFLVFTDHRKVIEDAESYGDGKFLVIRGAELHPENPYGGGMYHFVAVDLAADCDTAGRHPQEVIDRVTGAGSLVYLAHPSWSGHGRADLFPLHGYHGVEVANYGCREVDRMVSEDQWDDLNSWQGLTNGIAVDDGHRVNDIGGAWVMVNAGGNTVKEIKTALAEGRFYSSTGPEIYSVEVEAADVAKAEGTVPGTRIRVKSSPIVRAYLRSVPTHGAFIEGDETGEVEFTTRRRDLFYRVVVEDGRGRRAWSNPFVPERLFEVKT